MLLSSLAAILSLVSFQAPAPPSSDDLNNAFNELKSAEEKKDNDQVKKWAVECSNLARVITKAALPTDKTEAEAVRPRLDFAHEVATYAEYALSAAALRSTDHKQVIDLRDTLAQEAPDSKYLPGLNTAYLGALEGTGNQKKEFAFAEKAVGKDANNEALLAILADGYYNRKAWAQAANYGTRLASVSKHQALVGRGYYLAGQAYAAQSRHAQADKSLRAALPIIKSEPSLYANALFQLGISDYQLARATHDRVLMKQAIAFSEECAKLSSPVAGQASQNAFTMKKELAANR